MKKSQRPREPRRANLAKTGTDSIWAIGNEC